MTHKCDRTKFPFPKVNGESSLKHTWTLMSTLSSFFFRYIKSLFTKENKNQLFQVEGLTLFQRSEIHWWQNRFLAHPPHVRSEETDRNDFGGKKGHRAKNCCIYIGQILCDWASKTPTLCIKMLAWGVHKIKNLSDTQSYNNWKNLQGQDTD